MPQHVRGFLLMRQQFKRALQRGEGQLRRRIFRKSYYTVNKRLTYLMGNMLIKSFDRAENIYKSMESRGFTGEFHIYDKDKASTGTGIAILILFTIMPASLKILEFTGII